MEFVFIVVFIIKHIFILNLKTIPTKFKLTFNEAFVKGIFGLDRGLIRLYWLFPLPRLLKHEKSDTPKIVIIHVLDVFSIYLIIDIWLAHLYNSK